MSSEEVGVQPLSALSEEPLAHPIFPGFLASPQSLFTLSPRSPQSNGGGQKLQKEYFPTRPAMSQRATSSFRPPRPLKLETTILKTGKVKPVLLLVEDNAINMRVRHQLAESQEERH
jgi:hypothetical protein